MAPSSGASGAQVSVGCATPPTARLRSSPKPLSLPLTGGKVGMASPAVATRHPSPSFFGPDPRRRRVSARSPSPDPIRPVSFQCFFLLRIHALANCGDSTPRFRWWSYVFWWWELSVATIRFCWGLSAAPRFQITATCASYRGIIDLDGDRNWFQIEVYAWCSFAHNRYR